MTFKLQFRLFCSKPQLTFRFIIFKKNSNPTQSFDKDHLLSYPVLSLLFLNLINILTVDHVHKLHSWDKKTISVNL